MTNFMKETKKNPKFSQNENIFVKIGELFANFDKTNVILRKLGIFFGLFS